MYGKKSRGSKILATRGRGDFVKFYLAPPPPKCVLPLKCPPPQIPRPGAVTDNAPYDKSITNPTLCLAEQL